MEVNKWAGKVAIQYPQLRGSLAGIKFPAFGEIKYDGELNFIVKTPNTIFTVNKYGTCRTKWPLLDQIKNTIKANSATMLGEIYYGQGKLGALYELLSHKKDDSLHIRMFDMIEFNGASLKRDTLVERRERMLDAGLNPWMVSFKVLEDTLQVHAFAREAWAHKWEGIVVKPLDSIYVNGPISWVKMKYKDQSDYVVSSVDTTKERIEIINQYPVQVLMTGPKTLVDVLVGVKAPNRYKKHIKPGDTVTIEHQGVLKSGSLRHPVLIPKKGW